MNTVLIISQRFPPAFNVGGKRAYRFAKYLRMHGWRVVVWTAPLSEGQPQDETQFGLDELRTERTYEPRWWPSRDLSYVTDTAPLADENSPGKRLKRLLTIPLGRDVWLTPRALFLLRELCRRERVNVILASSGPHSALFQAWAASKLLGLPFCLDLRDPWSLNFLQRNKPLWVRMTERRIERMLFRRAARVILTCEDATHAYRDLYPELPADRMTTITNSFDPDFKVERTAPAGPVTLVHFGHCNGPRSLATILSSMARLRACGRWPDEGMRLINFGRVRARDLNLAASLGLSESFLHQEPLSYHEGISLLSRADLQILLGYADEKLFIPAKTFDYFLSSTPILCLAPRSALAELIERACAGRVVSPEDVRACSDVIEAAIDARNGGPPVASPLHSVIEQHDARFTAGQLAAHLNEVVAG
ncbi:MAG: hypothetical protein QOD00_3445 [Blastocatellia bacterium]|jgi:hypothetical protein|nr:hypothetical protein [Blastocatellia bacterium]